IPHHEDLGGVSAHGDSLCASHRWCARRKPRASTLPEDRHTGRAPAGRPMEPSRLERRGVPASIRSLLSRFGRALTAGVRWLRDVIDEVASSTPARLALVSFAAVVLVFVGLLSLPVSYRGEGAAEFNVVVFVAVSA